VGASGGWEESAPLSAAERLLMQLDGDEVCGGLQAPEQEQQEQA
jgi:hypothetical protein